MKKQRQPKMTYMKIPPTKWTFNTPRIQKWILEKVSEVIDPEEEVVLNLFAGKTLLSDLYEFRVDIVREFIDKGEMHSTQADWIGDAREFPLEWKNDGGKPFKVALLDPPYNVRKSREKYGGRIVGSFTRIKDDLHMIMDDNARIITWGYSSVGMSARRGYELTEVLLICHSGDHNDTIVTVEDRIKIDICSLCEEEVDCDYVKNGDTDDCCGCNTDQPINERCSSCFSDYVVRLED